MIPVAYLVQLLLAAGAVALAAYGVSRFLTGWSISLAERQQLLAEVNERSSHRHPTPRVGGIGLMAGVAVGFVVLAVALAMPQVLPAVLRPVAGAERSLGWLTLGGMAASTALAFALGLWDDRSNPPALVKLAGQVAIAAIPPLCGLRLREFHVPGMAAALPLGPLPGGALAALWILAVMNAVNFMDGINGLAGRFAVWTSVAAGLGVFASAGGETVYPLAAAIIGGAAGFLHYNLPQARTFMGDCGSQPLGALVAMLGLHVTTLPTTYPLPLLGFAAVVSVFLWDVGFTLVRRSLAGKNVLQAHREHLYQRYLIAHAEDHPATLFHVENHLLTTGLAGAAYLRWAFDPRQWLLQAILLGVVAASLAFYTRAALVPAAPPRPNPDS